MHLYLKKVVLILRDESDKEQFLPLAEKLQQAGIAVKYSKMIQGMGRSVSWGGRTKYDGMPRNDEKYGGTVSTGMQGDEVSDEKTEISEQAVLAENLYITDSVEKASILSANNLPVLGWLHESGDLLPELSYVMECPEELDVLYLERVYRRFHNIPWDILETEHCLLRETTVDDVDAFYEIYSCPEIVKFTENLYPTREREVAYTEEYIEKVYRYFEFGIWTVILKETGEIIGRAGLSVREGYDLPELGFVIGVPWQGRGIASEICSAILQYGEEEFGFDRVQALVQPENAASLALCRKLGFMQERTVSEGQQEHVLLIRNS